MIVRCGGSGSPSGPCQKLLKKIWKGAWVSRVAVTWVIRYFNPDAPFQPLHARALPIYALGAMLLGAQLLCMGLLAEMLTHHQSREEDEYSVAERTVGPAETDRLTE